MAVSLAIALGAPGGSVVANQVMNFTATVTNTAGAAVQLVALSTREVTKTGAQLSQPVFANPGQPAGSASQPTLAAAGSATYGFTGVFPVPNMPSVSPTNPGGAAPGPAAMEIDPIATIAVDAQFSDGSTGSATLTVPVLSAVYPFPVSDVGATQFRQGGNANLIAAIL